MVLFDKVYFTSCHTLVISRQWDLFPFRWVTCRSQLFIEAFPTRQTLPLLLQMCQQDVGVFLKSWLYWCNHSNFRRWSVVMGAISPWSGFLNTDMLLAFTQKLSFSNQMLNFTQCPQRWNIPLCVSSIASGIYLYNSHISIRNSLVLCCTIVNIIEEGKLSKWDQTFF